MTYQQLCTLIAEAANAVRDGLAYPGEDRQVLKIERAHRRDDIGCLEFEDIELREDVACRGQYRRPGVQHLPVYLGKIIDLKV